jgi:hypothetical protein
LPANARNPLVAKPRREQPNNRPIKDLLPHICCSPHQRSSERDLRGFVIKRKISGGTVSRDGRQARDSMLGLMKTCQKLGLSFWHYLGDRLGIGTSHPSIPPLATMIVTRA